MNTTQFIARAAGYNNNPMKPEKVQADTVSAKKGFITFYEGEQKYCLQCGNAHTKGYLHNPENDKRNKSFASLVIGKTSNFGYELAEPHGDFLCEYCGWLNAHFDKRTTARDGGRSILNVFIDKDGMQPLDFLSTSNQNALYDILKNPPEPPFFILINSGGTVLENMAFFTKPSISKKAICVTYGHRNLLIQPHRVFEAIKDSIAIASRFNEHTKVPRAKWLTGGEDLFWNRQGESGGYSISRYPYYHAEWFAKELSDFICKYDRPTRIVGKMIFLTYIKNNKTN